MATYSITRALVELKRLDARIAQAINSGTFAVVKVGKGEQAKINGSQRTVAQAHVDINSSFQQVDQLILNRAALKAAIVASNAKTVVTVGKAQMTVAEAIDLKATLPLRRQYMAGIRTQLVKANTTVEQLNARLEADIKTSADALLGGQKEMKDTTLADQLAEKQREQREAAVLAKQVVEDKLKSVEDDILNIETELDFVLSESNALTTIEIAD